MISGFLCAVRALLRSYIAQIGNSVPKSRDSLSRLLYPWRWDLQVVQKRRQGTTTLGCVKSQKSAHLILRCFREITKRSTAPLILNFGTKWIFKLRSLYPIKNTDTQWMGSWLGYRVIRAFWRREKSLFLPEFEPLTVQLVAWPSSQGYPKTISTVGFLSLVWNLYILKLNICTLLCVRTLNCTCR